MYAICESEPRSLDVTEDLLYLFEEGPRSGYVQGHGEDILHDTVPLFHIDA